MKGNTYRKQTLCVVDMQTYFSSTASPVRQAVVNEINKAKALGLPIVVMEYTYHDGEKVSETYPSIVKALEGYDKAVFVGKRFDGGGKEFVNACKIHKFSSKKVKFVGVNTGACVNDTAHGIYMHHNEKTSFELVVKATNCEDKRNSVNDCQRRFNMVLV